MWGPNVLGRGTRPRGAAPSAVRRQPAQESVAKAAPAQQARPKGMTAFATLQAHSRSTNPRNPRQLTVLKVGQTLYQIDY